jgi:putative membrane protein (TIGR04086 family)
LAPPRAEHQASRAPEPEGLERPARPQPLAIGVGALVAFLVLRLLSTILTATGLGEQFFLLPLAQFIALYTGGFAAGRMAPQAGFVNGVAVAILFIVVWAVLNAVYEAQLVQQAGAEALPKMNMGGIVIGDLLNLIPAAFGGWLADRRK